MTLHDHFVVNLFHNFEKKITVDLESEHNCNSMSNNISDSINGEQEHNINVPLDNEEIEIKQYSNIVRNMKKNI